MNAPRAPETPASIALDMARHTAAELASRKVKRKPDNTSTASLAAHLASFVAFELRPVLTFVSAEVQAHKRDESERAQQMHAAANALVRIERVLNVLVGGA